MRIMIKGGVWKNTEDEILKAAVMKYGKNQWSRISSLLVRKSAKQCKARWHEWLDPSIKKTEWSREEAPTAATLRLSATPRPRLLPARALPSSSQTRHATAPAPSPLPSSLRLAPPARTSPLALYRRRSRRPSLPRPPPGLPAGGEAAPPGQADADAVAHDRAHHRPHGRAVPRALRAAARPGDAQGPGLQRGRRPASAPTWRDRPQPGGQARAPRPDRHGRRREGDALGGARAAGEHARQEGEAQGAREAARGGAPPRRAAEATRAQGGGHRDGAARQRVQRRKRKVRGVDYNSEIPFQKMAPSGFYDTTGEDEQAEAAIRQNDGEFKSILKSKLEAPRKDLAEAKARKRDAEKAKKRKEDNLPEAVAALNKQNDLLAIQKRQRLMLPPPQVTDRELSDVVKASQSAFVDDGAVAQHVQVDATRMLTNSYEQTPSLESMRTPRTSSGALGGDTVLEEAAAQAAMLSQDTPLKGGESQDPASLGDFGGVTPRSQSGKAAATPNPNATPAHGGATPGATPARGGGGGATPSIAGSQTPGGRSVAGSVASSTPGRDAFGINADGFDADLLGLNPNAARRQMRERKAALGAQLAALPAPQHEYNIVMPDMPAEEGGGDDDARARVQTDGRGAAGLRRSPGAGGEEAREEDALDTQEREAAEAAAALAAEIATRSTAVQRELPRPLVVNREMLVGAGGEGGGEAAALAAADQMLREEMVKMLEADASAFPVKGAPENVKKKKPYKLLPPELLAQAAALIEEEQAALAARAPLPGAEAMRDAWEAAAAELIYVPSKQRYAPASSVSKAERLQAQQQQLQLVKNFMARDAKKAAKVEKKLEVMLGGYKKRASALAAEVVGAQQAVHDKRLELQCFEALARQEDLARPQRRSQMQALVSQQSARETELQARYAELLRTRDGLLEQLHARGAA